MHKIAAISNQQSYQKRPGAQRLRAIPIAAAVVLLGLLSMHARITGIQAQTSNPITIENSFAGTSNWNIPASGDTLADDTRNQIKGYASAPSVNVGNPLTFFVTVNP